MNLSTLRVREEEALTTVSADELFLGLLELDASGKVLYYRREQGVRGGPAQEIKGLNLFTDFAPLGQVKEFREQFINFSAGDDPARSFNLTLGPEPAALRLRVLLGRMSKRSDRGSTRSILVHIRKMPQQAPSEGDH